MLVLVCFQFINFDRASSYASAVLGVVILPVYLFFCPSVTRVLSDKTKQCSVDILIPHGRAITLVFWHRQWLAGDAPSVWNLRSEWLTPFEKRRLRQISAYNVSTVRGSEKVQLWQIASRPWAVQRARRSAYIAPNSLKGWLKKRFCDKNAI